MYETPHVEENEMELDLFMQVTTQEQGSEESNNEEGNGEDFAKLRGFW